MEKEGKYDDGFIDLYSRIQKLEKEISDGSSHDEDIQCEIRSLYQRILFEHPVIASTKRINNLLWKNCFHKRIESQRHMIKKLTAELDSKYKGRHGHVAQSFSQFKSEEKLLVMSTSLEHFVAQSLDFYHNLIATLEVQRNTSNLSSEYISQQLYMCYLHLGDLARYAEIHSKTSRKKDWTAARRYYERARLMMPNSGNAFNQLAVLAAYSLTLKDEDSQLETTELSVVYYYCRSILILSPFKTGVDNLRKMYKKIISRSSRQLRESQSFKNAGSSTFSIFLSRFLLIQGLLFYLSEHEAQRRTFSSSESTLQIDFEMTQEKAQALIREHAPMVMDDFDRILRYRRLKDETLLRMLTVCLFSVHFDGTEILNSSRIGDTGVSKSTIKKEEEPDTVGVRTARESLSLMFLYNVMNKICQTISPLQSSFGGIGKSLNTQKSRKASPKTSDFVQVVSIFCDWGQGDLGRTFFQQAIGTGVSLLENRKCEKAVASPLELLREENRSRSALRVALTALISSREIERLKSSSCGDFVEDATLDFPPLQEHRELRGFIPLNSVYEAYFTDNVGGPETHMTVDASQSCARRLQNIFKFVECMAMAISPNDFSSTATGKDAPPTDGRHRGKKKQILRRSDRKNSRIRHNNVKDICDPPQDRQCRKKQDATLASCNESADYKLDSSSISSLNEDSENVEVNEEGDDDDEVIVFKPLFNKACHPNVETSMGQSTPSSLLTSISFPTEISGLNCKRMTNVMNDYRAQCSNDENYDGQLTNFELDLSVGPNSPSTECHTTVAFAGLFGSKNVDDCVHSDLIFEDKSTKLIPPQQESDVNSGHVNAAPSCFDKNDELFTITASSCNLDCPPGFHAIIPHGDH